LENEMNYAFKYVMLNEEEVSNDEEWIEAKKLFINSEGYGYGASVYGIFLSYPGANMLSYHISSKASSKATLENVYIHDISHKTKEYVGLKTDLRMFVNSLNSPLHLQHLIGDETFSKYLINGGAQHFDNSMHYVGNILTDVTIAMHELSQNWGHLQIMYLLSDELVAWAKGEDSLIALGDASKNEVQYLCAVDGMGQTAKGAFGLRIDGVNDVDITNLAIENIVEYADLGYEICGKCTKCAFESRTPYQIGYSGNMAQGISVDYTTNLKITNLAMRNVESKTGRAFGFSIWPGTEVTLSGNIDVENIRAGTDVEEHLLTYESRPNAAPESCGIRIYDSSALDSIHDDKDLAKVITNKDAVVSTSCVEGHSFCWNVPNTWTQVGDYISCDKMEKTSNNLFNSIKNEITIATHKYRANKSDYAIPILLFSTMSIYVVIVYLYITRCVIKTDKLLINNRSEVVPLLNYGTIQRN